MAITDEDLEKMWESLGDVPIDNDERLETDFEIPELNIRFQKGTHRETVWEWFDVRHSKGVAYLMGIAE